MSEQFLIRPIAHIESDFKEKFGIPRQSGLVQELCSYIVFEPEFRDPEALRGLDGFSHIWVIWQFSKAISKWSPTVRPPRLGGNTRIGVFATRSPFRPNSLGLSSVRLDKIIYNSEKGYILKISGADILDGTPIYDIKPYLAYTDSHVDAVCGFADDVDRYCLDVNFPEDLLKKVPADKLQALLCILKQDPRPSYQSDPERIYGMNFAGLEIKFTVDGSALIVTEVEYC